MLLDPCPTMERLSYKQFRLLVFDEDQEHKNQLSLFATTPELVQEVAKLSTIKQQCHVKTSMSTPLEIQSGDTHGKDKG